ncbi:acyl-CoA thioesterase [Ereboglobus luteus]|uniref:Thioesterase n=1 Tax=Ereboglobus luteus TaxID=1796921 RepID=A0A2U8E0L0_9BACT|nr:thioesterase family protein [Ereboglobus luteus]AWI08234.1 thioesterase [Ereboglobus luteus]
MPFVHQRTIHFADTDAAGVVYFANYLSFCHEAYEESLAAAGIELRSFFSDNGIVIPISKSSADYLRPLACGDKISIAVKPAALSDDSYRIDYEITRLAVEGAPAKRAAIVRTEHVCIRSDDRARVALPPALAAWVARHGAAA